MSTRISYWEKIYGSEQITLPYKKRYRTVDLVRDKEILDLVTHTENKSKITELFITIRCVGNEIKVIDQCVELTATEIQNRVHLSKPTVLSILEELVKDGKLVRNRSLNDPHVWKYSANHRRNINMDNIVLLYDLCEQLFDNDTHTFMLSLFSYLKDKRHWRGLKS